MERSQRGFKTRLWSLPSVRATRAQASVERDEKDHSQLDDLGIVPDVNGLSGPGQFLPHPVHGSTLVHIPCRRLCFLFQFRSPWSFHVLLMPVWVFFFFSFCPAGSQAVGWPETLKGFGMRATVYRFV